MEGCAQGFDSIKNKELIVLEVSEVDLLKGGHRHETKTSMKSSIMI